MNIMEPVHTIQKCAGVLWHKQKGLVISIIAIFLAIIIAYFTRISEIVILGALTLSIMLLVFMSIVTYYEEKGAKS